MYFEAVVVVEREGGGSSKTKLVREYIFLVFGHSAKRGGKGMTQIQTFWGTIFCLSLYIFQIEGGDGQI